MVLKRLLYLTVKRTFKKYKVLFDRNLPDKDFNYKSIKKFDLQGTIQYKILIQPNFIIKNGGCL